MNKSINYEVTNGVDTFIVGNKIHEGQTEEDACYYAEATINDRYVLLDGWRYRKLSEKEVEELFSTIPSEA